MGILAILARNLRGGSRTRRPDDRVPEPVGYRGELAHDAAGCTACTACSYVCSPSAIVVRIEGESAVTWRYDAGACTFCGRCASICPTSAIRLNPTVPALNQDRRDSLIEHRIPFHRCERCGRPILPLPGSLLVKAYGDPLPQEIARTRLLCPSCRARRASENVRDALKGELHAD